MAEFSPAPSPAFSGIDFNPSFFPSTTSDYVEFPTAQGTVTFGTIFATTIDTPTPSADFDFLDSAIGNINIGTAVPAGQTIKLGQNTGASIHCGSIDLQGTNINNSVASDTGTISLAPKQTSGTLNIGSHPTTATRTTGAINIGSNSLGAQVITIGTSSVGSTTILNGTNVTATTKLTTPILDCVDAGSGNTSLAIGGSATSGNIIIGAALGVGDVSIAAAQSAGGTVTIGSSNTVTTLSGTSVDVPTNLTATKIDASTVDTAMTIGNNLTNGTLAIGGLIQTGDMSIAEGQTSGDLYIGAGDRTAASDINFGTGTNGAGNLFIGHKTGVISTQAVKINTSSAAGASGATTIGSTTSATSIGGSLGVTGLITASGGLALSGANGISLTTTSYTPALNQLGYTVFVLEDATTATTGGTANIVTNITSATIPAGTFIVHFSGGGAIAGQYNIGINTTSALFVPEYTMGATTIVNFTQNYARPALTVIIQNTAPTVWYLNQSANTTGYVSTRTTWYYTRIA